MKDWAREVHILGECLERLTVWDADGKDVEPDRGFEIWIEQVVHIREHKGTVFFIGNGASASMASHFAADLGKNAQVRTQTFYDLSLLTAIGNDISFDAVFSEPLRRCLSKGDMVIAISSSGESPNILEGVRTAAEGNGYVVTLSAMKPENRLRRLGQINFYVPAKKYGPAETAHAAILHFWLDHVMTA